MGARLLGLLPLSGGAWMKRCGLLGFRGFAVIFHSYHMVCRTPKVILSRSKTYCIVWDIFRLVRGSQDTADNAL